MVTSEITSIESELVKSANGNTNTLLLILLVVFVLGLLTLLIRYLMNKLPEEMAKDREYIGNIITANNTEHCNQIKNLVTEVKELVSTNIDNNKELVRANLDNSKTIVDIIQKHDEQAKKILDNSNRIETKLDTRPCARVYSDQQNFIKH